MCVRSRLARVLASAPAIEYISPAMESCSYKAETSAERQLETSGSEAQYIAPVDHFTLVDQFTLDEVEPRSQHEDGIRARIPRTACYTVTCSRRQKTAAGLYDYNRQRHTQLCP